jgi:hypothetical protein
LAHFFHWIKMTFVQNKEEDRQARGGGGEGFPSPYDKASPFTAKYRLTVKLFTKFI